jgi:protocatechuate 3,4-dioxygenase beta subunit
VLETRLTPTVVPTGLNHLVLATPPTAQLVFNNTTGKTDLVVTGNPAGGSAILVNTSTTTYTVTVNGVTYQFGAAQVTGHLVINAQGNLANSVQVTGPVSAEIHAGNGNDTVTGGAGDDVIWGGNGNDVIQGGGGNDVLISGSGGTGHTRIAAGSGHNILVAGTFAPGPVYFNGSSFVPYDYNTLHAIAEAWAAGMPDMWLLNNLATSVIPAAAPVRMTGGTGPLTGNPPTYPNANISTNWFLGQLAPGPNQSLITNFNPATDKRTALFQPVSVSGNVYNDLNGDGSSDGTDPGLQGWTVKVLDASNNVVGSAMTDPIGNYTITGIAAGTFTLVEVLQNDWLQTQPVSPGSYSFTTSSGMNLTGKDFGNFQTITISGQKFNDLQGVGSFVPGDPGLPGWTIDLLNSAGSIVATTVTDPNGNYSFTGLGPGTYTVQEELQPGWIQTAPAPPGTYTVVATSGSNLTGLLFGNFQLVTLSGMVYNDLNGDGSSDGGTDPGLQGWTVNLLDPSGNIVATTTSNSGGTYSFANLGPGTYTLQEVVQTGWVQTQPTNPPGTYTLQAISSTNASGLDFGNFQSVTVSGNVYNDLNGNGQDQGEPGLQGWTVNVVDAGGNVVATATSDANGKYTITGVGPGSFTLQEVVQGGWVVTQPANPSYYSFTTSSGVNVTGGIFGNFETVSVSGNVYNDLDGNGLRNGSEPGLQGWTVNLEDSSGNILASVVTDPNGNYSFAGVGPGSYQVAEVVQTNWVQTQPLFPTSYSFTTQSGHNLIALNFGDHNAPAINPTQVIDNGQPGYSETGTWSTVVGGFNGTNRVAQTVHSGSATATTTWDFTGVGNGLFDVWVTFAGKSGYSQAAPFTIFDGGTSLGTQSIDESQLVTQGQGGRAQGSYGGVGWIELGSFSISSGEIKVVLNNLASGNFVGADGVLIVKH